MLEISRINKKDVYHIIYSESFKIVTHVTNKVIDKYLQISFICYNFNVLKKEIEKN